MTEPYIEHIWVDKITESDIILLQKLENLDMFGYKVEHMLEAIKVFNMQLWRGTGENVHFLLITQVFAHPAGNEMRIWAVVGRGYKNCVEKMYATLCEYGKNNGVKWLTGSTRRNGFDKLYKMLKNSVDYKWWVVEI